MSKTIRCIDIDLWWRPKTLVFDKYHKHIRFVCFITQSIWIVLSYRWNTHERENIYQNNVSFLLLNILNTIEDKINSKCKVSTVCHGNNANTIVPAALVVCLLIILPCEVVNEIKHPQRITNLIFWRFDMGIDISIVDALFYLLC